MKRSIDEINEKLKSRKATVIRADEMTKLVKEQGYKTAFNKVDVVTTGTFGAMCSSGVFFNFKHFNPPAKLQEAYFNDVRAYGGIATADVYLGVTEASKNNEKYGGAQVIEELIRGKSVKLISTANPSDCYPGNNINHMFKLEDLNQAIMLNPRNGYQKYNGAVNTSDKTLHTYMGKLSPAMQNVNYSGAGTLNPIMNDPDFETIGAGSNLFIGGDIGMIVGSGTQHSPANQFSTLMTTGNLKNMSVDFLRAAYIRGYGSTLFIGLGFAIPVLNDGIANKTGVADEDIAVDIIDFSVQSNNRPVIKTTDYRELRSGRVKIDGRDIRTSSLSSYSRAVKVAEHIKKMVLEGEYEMKLPINGI